ncbi:SDR family oxidoreductase [Massilia sp. 9096]|uniref:SDR family oxidoreductase n=1 Tax=Massilia sp. 9096 TaxID=1500894 RepID=UPI00055F7F14|nr:SDR family oxidoreductase [Massilia sp. 9096]
MRIFMTGATGFIGSRVVQDLLEAGHQVPGLARTDDAVLALAAAGAQALRGDLTDLISLRRGVADCDGVIHTAFVHEDMSRFKQACDIDLNAINAMAEALARTNRPLVVTSGTAAHTEDLAAPVGSIAVPRMSEQAATKAVAQQMRASIVRLPQVHDRNRQGLVSYLIALARAKGMSAYIEEGMNRWPAVHRSDAALLYRQVLEYGLAGARYHAVAEEGVTLRAIAEAIGRRLGVPVVSLSREDAGDHFGWLAFFVGLDMPASSALTRARLHWRPKQADTMIEDRESSSARK